MMALSRWRPFGRAFQGRLACGDLPLYIKSRAGQRKGFADARRRPEKNSRLREPRGTDFSYELVAAARVNVA
jgi:hypothetical protein